MFERFTDRARRVLVLSQEESRRLGHHEIGVEHIILGLIAEGDGIACRALVGAGADLESARAAVADLIPTPVSLPAGSPPFTPRAKEVLAGALREALAMRHAYIGPEHILLGVLDLGATDVTLFDRLGLDVDDLRGRVDDMIQTGIGQPRDIGVKHPWLVGGDRVSVIHLLEGHLRAIELYGEIVEAASHCADRRELLAVLVEPPFGFSPTQAVQVLDMNAESVTTETRARYARELSALRRDGGVDQED